MTVTNVTPEPMLSAVRVLPPGSSLNVTPGELLVYVMVGSMLLLSRAIASGNVTDVVENDPDSILPTWFGGHVIVGLILSTI